jgi:hypothetical protein
VLVDAAGVPIGMLPPFEVEVPYWQEAAQIVSGAQKHHGVAATVLRLLATEPGLTSGGAVTYLAQVDRLPDGYLPLPSQLDLSPDPRRAGYAQPGGPAASLQWARTVLADLGAGPVTDAQQQRTWNLSAIWRLDTPAGPVWLKEVPAFFQHEPVVLRWTAAQGGPVPELLASDGGRMLLGHVPGEDMYGAGIELRHTIAADHHRLQLASTDHIGHLIGSGTPDRRTAALVGYIQDTVARHGTDPRVHELVADLPTRMDQIAATGLPDVLVHGDLHPGNVRSDGQHHVIIDWGDAFIGHPGFDILRLGEGLDDPQPLIDAWAGRWQRDVPGCDPYRALELLGPVAALRNAAVYAAFLDAIEPHEHPYHAGDVPLWLGMAVDRLLANGRA